MIEFFLECPQYEIHLNLNHLYQGIFELYLTCIAPKTTRKAASLYKGAVNH